MAGRRRQKLARPAGRAAASSPAEQQSEARQRARRLLRLTVIGYLFFAGSYAVAIPLGKGPDETAHVRYIAHLAEQHRLPVFDRQNPGPDYEFHQPPLFYLLCLPAYRLLGGGDPGAHAARFVSILIGAALLYLTFALARALVPDRPWVPPAAAAGVAFLPMHLGLVASTSNDALTEVLVAAALLLMVQHLRAASEYRHQVSERAPSLTAMAAAGAMIGLGLLTKSTAVMLFPVIWAAAALAGRGPHRYEWGRLLRDLAVSTGLALLIGGWWLARNQVLYGDLLAQQAFLLAFRDRPSPQYFMERYHVSPLAYVLTVVLPVTVATAWGAFGPVYGNRFAFFPFWVYLFFTAKALVEGASFGRCLRRAPLADWQRQGWWVSAVLLGLLLLGFIRFNLSFFQAQARYLFPALPPVAAALCLGLNELAPRRWQRIALLSGMGLLVLLAFVGLPLWITPQFQLQPPVAP